MKEILYVITMDNQCISAPMTLEDIVKYFGPISRLESVGGCKIKKVRTM